MQNQNMPRRAARKAQKKGSAAPLFFIIFFVLLLLAAALFMFDFFGGSRRSAVEYTIGNTTYKLSAGEAYADNTLLVCFDDVAALCGMTDVGGSDARSYFAENSEENITFTAGSKTAVLNGKEIDMPTEAVLRDGKMYVPLELLPALDLAPYLSRTRFAAVLPRIWRTDDEASLRAAPIARME